MTELQDFVRSFSDNDRLIHAAEKIPCKIKRVNIDPGSYGMEWILVSDDTIPDGADLIRLGKILREEIGISNIRFILRGEAYKNISEVICDSLQSWIKSELVRQDPLLCAPVEAADFQADDRKVIVTVRCPADPALIAYFSDRAEQFTQKHLPKKCRFEVQCRPEKDFLSNRARNDIFEEKLKREADEILSRQVIPAAQIDPKATGAPHTDSFSKEKGRQSNQNGSNVWERRSEKVVSGDRGAFKGKNPERNLAKKADWGRMNEQLPFIKISDMNETTGAVIFEGKIEIEEMKLTKSGRKVCVKFFVTDKTGSVPCVLFLVPSDADRFSDEFEKNGFARLQADVCFDARYTKDLSAAVSGLKIIPAPEKRADKEPVKRVELHCHSKMSEKDAVINVEDLVEEASRLGHRACALTDHGVVQGFPEAAEALARIKSAHPDRDFKMIYGMEGYLVDDGPAPVLIPDGRQTNIASFVALRVETTGSDPQIDRICAVYATRFRRNGDGRYTQVDSLTEVPSRDPITTGEANAEANKGSDIFPMLGRVADFIGKDAVCGWDILHSLAFLRYAGFDVDIEKHDRYRIKFNPVAVETKTIEEWLQTQEIDPETFDSISDPAPDQHACDPDLFRSAKILAGTLRLFARESLTEINDKVGKIPDNQLLARKQTVYHVVLLVQNTLGLYHLYRLVSESHLRYYSHRPRMPKSLLNYYRDGLIIGSACERGEVFGMARTHYTMNNLDLEKARASLTADPSFLHISELYDYFEVQPVTNNSFYLRDPGTGLKSTEDLRNLNRLVMLAGESMGKMVCATTDAHFLEKEDGEFRKYLLLDMEYKDAQDQADLYFRTTREMLDEFSYMGAEKAEEIVIKNTNVIADRIDDDIKPFPDGTFPPIIDTAADEIRSVIRKAVGSMYTFRGEVAPIVEERVRKELDSIIGNGFAIMYYIAYMLVKKSNEDGYIVGSRGSVGSSLVATLCGISEVNPLPPHYRCPQCAYSEFDASGRYGSGYDLPPKNCPHCGENMIRDGQEIPFETFLGFYGDKQPDIDLNFSSEYQSRAHRYVEELFGTSHTFRAGTIGCFAEKNAIAVVSKICEQNEKRINRAELRRRSRGLIGVKRTTGQHPGGIVVVPREMDVYEFTPIQYPANKKNSGVITTHFDFNAMHDTILKLDILGHYDPTVLRMLGDLTGVDVRSIPIPDPKVMSLFSSSDALGIRDKNYENHAATLGLSEMGTFMARDMIAETRPATFFDLVQLMGLSHGTDVWKGNAQDLIRSQTCTLKNVIGCRDSIMTVLIQRGISNKEAFDIMERVRKGRGLKADQEAKMREHKVPEWYIESCKKIKYMFPKAHAAAYAISSLRIAWFKVYYPEEYYCAFFSIRADEFDGDTMCRGVEIAKSRRKAIHEGFSARKQTEKAQYYLYELIEEMTARGIEFIPFDLERSEADRFVKVSPGKILPPINAITSVSTAMARAICAARDEKPFATREEVMIRSGIGPAALEKLAASGILDHLPESVQIDLFSLL